MQGYRVKGWMDGGVFTERSMDVRAGRVEGTNKMWHRVQGYRALWLSDWGVKKSGLAGFRGKRVLQIAGFRG